jgi:hypothetical protein
MTSENACPACGGTGWVEVRTRGMCGCESDFEEVERTACALCDAHLELETSRSDG